MRAVMIVAFAASCATTPYRPLAFRPRYREEVAKLMQVARQAAAAHGFDVVAEAADHRWSLALDRNERARRRTAVVIRVIEAPAWRRNNVRAVVVTPLDIDRGVQLSDNLVPAYDIEAEIYDRLRPSTAFEFR